jgi:uncharacterized membrane protein YqaE (UPF0057 family)
MHTLLLIILAFIMPPLAVFMKSGTNLHFFVNITIYIVGIILTVSADFAHAFLITALHAIWVICTTD